MNEATETAEVLARRCLEVAKLADAAIAWVGYGENRDKVGADVTSLRREFRRSHIRVRKLANAAKRNMCVGVYGPSQAGKSYLISVLGRPKGGELMAAFDGVDEPLRYLDQINPEGQGESTGLVTRFTAARVPAEPGFPIKVRLLSEADVARVLANAFAMDGDGAEPAPSGEEIEELLANAEAKVGDSMDPAFATEEMWDVQEYVSGEFGRLAYFAPLRTYWDRAAAAAPKLDPAGRAELLSVLWGRHRPLTELFLSLASHLKALGDAREAFVPIAALSPREQSIIDVQTLKELDGEAAFPTVDVRTASGASATMARGELTALVSEVIVPMAGMPWNFMKETDLLDFPGTRNRFTHDLADYLEKGEAPLAQLFLRGKVAYLFDRYVAEQELTSMLLCVGEGNMEAKDLPGLIERWIAATHGSTPEQRLKARCILFFVLTKFDTLLLESGGAGDDPRTRFDRRIQNSMIEPFGKLPDSWLNRWAGNAPFRNTFWLRNPKYEATVIEYGEGREVRLRPDREDRIAELREGAVGSELVRRHFDDPDSAWKEAMEIDDGGVTRLAGALAEVCVPSVKLAQIEDQLDIQVRHLLRRLVSYYESSDIDTRLAEKREAAGRLVDALDNCFDRNRWGELMEALMVDPAHIADEIARVPADIHIVSDAEAARAGRPAPGGNASSRPRPGRSRPGGGEPAVAERPASVKRAPAADPASQIRRTTMEAFQAERALTVWKDILNEFLKRPEHFGGYKMTAEAADDLVAELIVATRRLGLEARIRTALERWNFSLLSERRALPASTVAASEINAFVARLGMDELDEADRPVVEFEGTSRPVFAEPPVQYAFRSLPDRPRSGAEDRFVDWTFALHRLFEDNARNVDGRTVDTRQNRRLGEILEGLKANGQASAGDAP